MTLPGRPNHGPAFSFCCEISVDQPNDCPHIRRPGTPPSGAMRGGAFRYSQPEHGAAGKHCFGGPPGDRPPSPPLGPGPSSRAPSVAGVSRSTEEHDARRNGCRNGPSVLPFAKGPGTPPSGAMPGGVFRRHARPVRLSIAVCGSPAE
jgi:hypothetical protein